MKIYTRTGDRGKTSLFDGTRVAKNNIRVETYGTIDELNSVIGMVVSQITNPKSQIPKKSDIGHWDLVIGALIEVQKDLFEIGASLANPKDALTNAFIKRLGKRVEEFEHLIDSLTASLPELTNFILPGGSISGATLQFARAISRRTERQIITLSQKENVDQSIIMYLNRLSDLLFTMSRFVNAKAKIKETIWSK